MYASAAAALLPPPLLLVFVRVPSWSSTFSNNVVNFLMIPSFASYWLYGNYFMVVCMIRHGGKRRKFSLLSDRLAGRAMLQQHHCMQRSWPEIMKSVAAKTAIEDVLSFLPHENLVPRYSGNQSTQRPAISGVRS